MTITAAQHKALREWAQVLMKAQPATQAVVLFGSHARGDAHAESDWDIATIVHRARTASHTQAYGDVRMNLMQISPTRMRQHERAVHTIEAHIAHDGIVLAGHWNVGAIPRAGRRPPWAHLAEAVAHTRKLRFQALDALLEDDIATELEHANAAICIMMRTMVQSYGVLPQHRHHLSITYRQLIDTLAARGTESAIDVAVEIQQIIRLIASEPRSHTLCMAMAQYDSEWGYERMMRSDAARKTITRCCEQTATEIEAHTAQCTANKTATKTRYQAVHEALRYWKKANESLLEALNQRNAAREKATKKTKDDPMPDTRPKTR